MSHQPDSSDRRGRRRSDRIGTHPPSCLRSELDRNPSTRIERVSGRIHEPNRFGNPATQQRNNSDSELADAHSAPATRRASQQCLGGPATPRRSLETLVYAAESPESPDEKTPLVSPNPAAKAMSRSHKGRKEMANPAAHLSIYSNGMFVLGSALYVVSAAMVVSPSAGRIYRLVLDINVIAAVIFIFNGLLDTFLALFYPVGPAGTMSSTVDLFAPLARARPHYGFVFGGILFCIGSCLYAWSAVYQRMRYPGDVDPMWAFGIDLAASHTFVLDSVVYLLAAAPKGIPWTRRLRHLDFWGDLGFLVGSLAYAVDSWICAPFVESEGWCQETSLFAAAIFMLDSLIYSYAKWREGKLGEGSLEDSDILLPGSEEPSPTGSITEGMEDIGFVAEDDALLDAERD